VVFSLFGMLYSLKVRQRDSYRILDSFQKVQVWSKVLLPVLTIPAGWVKELLVSWESQVGHGNILLCVQ
jgi:hypothetical protein